MNDKHPTKDDLRRVLALARLRAALRSGYRVAWHPDAEAQPGEAQ